MFVLIFTLPVIFANAADKTEKQKKEKPLPEAKEEERLPIKVISDTSEYFEAQNMVKFKGNVEVDDGKVKMICDKMDVFMGKDKKIKKIIAYGNVKIKKEEMRSNSEKAVYYIEEDKIILTGDPVVNQNEREIRSDIITFFREDERILTGRAVFNFPKNDMKKEDAKENKETKENKDLKKDE